MTTEDQGNRKDSDPLAFLKNMKLEQNEARSAHLLSRWLYAKW